MRGHVSAQPTSRGGRSSAGFALFDLLLVVVILAVVAGAAIRVPGTTGLELDVAARGVAADLLAAQTLALETRTAFGLRIDPATHQTHFVLGTGQRPAAIEATLRASATLSAVEVERLLAARSRGETGWTGVRVAVSSFNGSANVVFEPDGSVRDGGYAELRANGTWLRVRVQTATGRIVITAP
jgi:Tfp pilus assembly protein FimT